MSRLINPESAGKERNRLAKAVVLTLREMLRQKEPDAETRDMAAFIIMALQIMAETIDITVAAWEKRNYWIKADRFRLDWSWTSELSSNMYNALLEGDWTRVAAVSAQVAQQLKKIAVPERHRMGRPWTGAWEELIKKTSGR